MGAEEITMVDDEITIVPMGYKIKSKGTFNLEDLYFELHLWFEHHGYSWKELEYKKIVFGGGAERIELLWTAEKKVDDYTNFVIDLNMAADTSKVEVALDGGKKVKRHKGGIEFRSGAKIKKNVDVWKGKAFGNVQAKVYEMLINDRIGAQKGELYAEAHKLYDELKAFMILYR